MSKTPKNKRYVELQGIRVYHNKKDNTIQIITTDPDITGLPFQITLGQGTPTEETLKNLLIEKQVLTEEEAYPQRSLPEYVQHPNLKYSPDNPYTLIEDNPILPLGESKWHQIPLGVSKDSNPVILDLKKAPHSLITGGTGRGKSILLNNFLLHAVHHPDDWLICAIDLKRVEFSYLRKHSQSLFGLGLSFETSIKLLRDLEATIHLRYEKMKKERVHNFRDLKPNIEGLKAPAIMLVIDEVAELMNSYPSQDKVVFEQKSEARRIISEIARIGRSAGVFMVLSSQRADATLFPGELKACLDNRIAVGRMDRNSSTMILGVDAASQIPSNVSGRAMIRINKELVLFQTYFVPNMF